MADHKDKLFIPEDKYVLNDLLVGGDGSDQGPLDNRICCYAVTAVHENQLDSLNSIIENVIKTHTGLSDASAIELHTKQIWNGSERKRSPFSKIETKAAMKEFFSSVAKAIGHLHPYIVVAVDVNSKAPASKELRTSLKQHRIYAAFSRLNQNIKLITGKWVGRPRFLLDYEDDRLIRPITKGGLPGGYLYDVGVVNDSEENINPKLYVRSDPVYLPTDSQTNRLIQVADLASYFVGKYLVLYSEIIQELEKTKQLSDRLYLKMADCNYALSIWDQLNLESILLISSGQFKQSPAWLKPIMKPYEMFFLIGGDMCYCSMREAISNLPSKEPRLSGIGYWALTTDRA